MSSTHIKGRGFEQLVGELYACLGYSAEYNVRRAIPKKHRINGSEFNEFDLVLSKGLWLAKKELVIECKYRSQDKVRAEEVTWFAAKLNLHGIKVGKGRLVTNYVFQDTAKIYANDLGLTLLGFDDLFTLYKKTLSWRKRTFGRKSTKDLDKLIRNYCS